MPTLLTHVCVCVCHHVRIYVHRCVRGREGGCTLVSISVGLRARTHVRMRACAPVHMHMHACIHVSAGGRMSRLDLPASRARQHRSRIQDARRHSDGFGRRSHMQCSGGFRTHLYVLFHLSAFDVEDVDEHGDVTENVVALPTSHTHVTHVCARPAPGAVL